MLAVAIGMLAASVWLLVVGVETQNAFAILGSAVLVSVAFLMRPRLGKVPSDDVVSRSRAPALYALADDVAAHLGTRGADRIVIDSDWNASWHVAGIRQVRVLSLGLPLLAVLGPQDRVALVAHELAHARNGDARRGLVVGSAWRALAELYGVLAPDQDAQGWESVMNPVFWVVSRPIYALLLLHARLTAHDAQRGEYVADARAAETAGTDAAVRLAETLLLESVVRSVIKRSAQARASDVDGLLSDLEHAVRTVPDRERERRRRVARLERSSLDVFHPPIAARIAVLESGPNRKASVALTAPDSARIDAELRPLQATLARRMVEEYRASLYY